MSAASTLSWIDGTSRISVRTPDAESTRTRPGPRVRNARGVKASALGSDEARPLIGHLVSQVMVCASANYGLRPHVGYDEQIADCLAAIERVRSHAREYGGDPERTFLVGSSAGAYLAIDAVNAGTDGIAGIVGRCGYYGDLMPERPRPPILVIHGENDLLVRPSHAREFVERMRASSSVPAEFIELPGGHHDFDLYESIRSNAISIAVERFIMSSGRKGAREST